MKSDMFKLVLLAALLLPSPIVGTFEASQTPSPNPGPTDPTPNPIPPIPPSPGIPGPK